MEKKCSKCNVVKDVSEFSRRKDSKDGFRNNCKLCRRNNDKANRERINIQQKKYYQSNKEKFSSWSKKWRNNNKDKIAEKRKEWYEANKDSIREAQKKYKEENREKIAEYRKANRSKKIEYMNKYNHTPKAKEKRKNYYKTNKEEINNYSVKYVKSRIKTDSLFRLKWSTRANIHRYLKDGKSKRIKEILGIDFKEFQDYLKVEYTEGMHLDHIIPLSWAINDEEVYILNHYSNFQIIPAEENLAKKDTYCKSENLKKVLDNHNDLTKLNKIIERNSDKIT